MNSFPLVSVIIPTYKRPTSMLERAIESVFAQTYENIEIIVVDDNAKPETVEFRENNRKYFSTLNNIRVIYNDKNLGGSLSRNVGINAANGKYITFLDDDDVFLPDKVKHQIDYMLENDLNCSFTDLSLYNENDKLIDRRVRNDIKSFDKLDLMKYHLVRVISSTETFMVTKELLEDIGGFDDAVSGQEFYLMYKILKYDNLKIGYFESDDIKAYRTRQESISNSPSKIIGENKLYEFRKQHFDILNHKERNYIKCRHRAVMAVGYKRNKKYLKSFFYLVGAFLTNPIISFKEGLMFFKRIKK